MLSKSHLQTFFFNIQFLICLFLSLSLLDVFYRIYKPTDICVSRRTYLNIAGINTTYCKVKNPKYVRASLETFLFFFPYFSLKIFSLYTLFNLKSCLPLNLGDGIYYRWKQLVEICFLALRYSKCQVRSKSWRYISKLATILGALKFSSCSFANIHVLKFLY